MVSLAGMFVHEIRTLVFAVIDAEQKKARNLLKS